MVEIYSKKIVSKINVKSSEAKKKIYVQSVPILNAPDKYLQRISKREKKRVEHISLPGWKGLPGFSRYPLAARRLASKITLPGLRKGKGCADSRVPGMTRDL